MKKMPASPRLAVDIGGTFTDVVLQSGTQQWTSKVLTTPRAPEEGVVEAMQIILAQSGVQPDKLDLFILGTTLATNALIERKGAKTGLLTTAGFRDVLEIGRERKYELYDLFIEMPKPLVPRPWRREAVERLAPAVSVEKKLNVEAALAEVAELVKEGVESLAICFLPASAPPAPARALGPDPHVVIAMSGGGNSFMFSAVSLRKRCSVTFSEVFASISSPIRKKVIFSSV